MLPDEEGSKVNACVNEVFRIWEENSDKRLTQLLFCDLSTPKGAGEFSVYTDIRQKLIERGIPESEIKFIHEADTETKKQELFKKVRRGEVRDVYKRQAQFHAGQQNLRRGDRQNLGGYRTAALSENLDSGTAV